MTHHKKTSCLLTLASLSLMILATPYAHAQSSSSSVTEERGSRPDSPSGSPAGGGPEDGQRRMMRGDANQDGFLSKDEMAAEHQKRFDEMFSKADADKDGKLSPEEMREGRKAMRAKMQEHMAKRTAKLKDLLQITPAQEGADPPPGIQRPGQGL